MMQFEEKQPSVYIMASRYRGTLYIGVTSNLGKRVLEHKDGSIGGFTAKYDVKTLVWYEHHATMDDAILRETQLKAWRRAWKLELIEGFNPDWIDLHELIQYRAGEIPKRGSISRRT
jgi:putative endonuclease